MILLLFCLLFSVQSLEAQSPRDFQSFINDAFSGMDEAFSQIEFTPEDEYYLGRAVAANIMAAYKPYTGNPELTRYLNLICQTIVINSLFPAKFNGYHVIILDSSEFNAFASPGGHIFLTRALVELTASEDMLAAVIAHEIAHVMLRHSISVIDEMRFYDEATSTAERAAALANNSPSAIKLMSFRNSVSAIIDTLVKNGYSRSQEFEADGEATALLAASGYDPGALQEILMILRQVQTSQKGGFNTSHPSPSERIVNVEGWVNRYRTADTSPSRLKRFINK
jgi:predicted Zn-dependent protease